MPPPAELAAASHLVLTGLLQGAAVLYAAAFVTAALRPAWGRPVLALGALAHLAGAVGRGLAIEFFPLTNKMESFSAAALALALVAALVWRNDRLQDLPMVGTALAAMAAALSLPQHLAWPPPLMRTVWYPIHPTCWSRCSGSTP